MADPEKQPEQPKAAQQKQIIGKLLRSLKYLLIYIYMLEHLSRTGALAYAPPSS